MSESLMLRCEQKKLFLKNGERELRWVIVDVGRLTDVNPKQIRCMHCHGAVRIHRKQAASGPQDHVEHLSRKDSENSQGGVHFGGVHRMSLQPVG